MIDFHAILSPACTRVGVVAQSKKAALEEASVRIAAVEPAIEARGLLEGLLERERLGSTGLGEGVAIPHCRCAECRTPVAAFFATDSGIDFDAPDDAPVDLLFTLAVPVDEHRQHLEILGALARVFDDPANLAALRRARSHEALFDAFQRQLASVQRE